MLASACPLRTSLYRPGCSTVAVSAPGTEREANPLSGFCRTFSGAPGRIRTCDRRIRSPLLCPLSYGRIRLM
jgi:hypothetical protein